MRERAVVLRKEPFDAVRDLPGVVQDAERVLESARVGLREEGVARMRRVESLGELGVRRLGQPTHLVQQVKQPGRHAALLVRNEGDAARIVGPRDRAPRDTLGDVELLLRREDVQVERGLQLLIRKVDEELLERIRRERLEAEDIEQADEGGRRRGRVLAHRARELGVDERDRPLKERRVDRLHEPLAHRSALVGIEHDVDGLRVGAALHGHGTIGEAALERARLEPQERARRRKRAVGALPRPDAYGRRIHSRIIATRHPAASREPASVLEPLVDGRGGRRNELEITQVEHAREAREQARLLLGRHAEAFEPMRELGEALSVRMLRHAHAAGMAQHVEAHRPVGRHAPLGALRGGGAGEHLVEDVEVALRRQLPNHSRRLE